MKLWVFSDLHLDVKELREPLIVPNADVCVVAGDVLTRGVLPSQRWLDENVASQMPVVFTAENHAFLLESLEAARQFRGSGRVHFLEDSSVRLGGVVSCGATLWSDFDVLGKGMGRPRPAQREGGDARLRARQLQQDAVRPASSGAHLSKAHSQP
jgi:Icc-related predicted phosphoesterase